MLRPNRDRNLFLKKLFQSGKADFADGLELALRFHGRDREMALRSLLATQRLKNAHPAQRIPLGERAATFLLADTGADLGPAVSAIKRLLPSNRTADVLAFALTRAARTNAAAASEFLDEIAPGARRQQTIAEIGGRWAAQDTAAALSWANSLVPEEGAAARSAIQNVAPVGIGLALRTDAASGYPLAMQSVPGGPAARSGAIAQGDRIVAVMDSQNVWTQTAGQNLDAVIRLIRGPAGESVQIRVLPAGSADLAQARTVTLQREQVLFKSPDPGG